MAKARRKKKVETKLTLDPDTLTAGDLKALDSIPIPSKDEPDLVESLLDIGLRQNLKTLGDEVENGLIRKLKVLGQFYGLDIKAKILFELTKQGE